MFVNSDKATLDTLQQLMEDALMTATDKKIYLKADQELEYGTLIDVIEIIKAAGVEDFGIIADKKRETLH